LITISFFEKKIKEERVADPNCRVFILFATYGGLLIVTITHTFWQWSGLASLEVYTLFLLLHLL
jgi:hypothetical protein